MADPPYPPHFASTVIAQAWKAWLLCKLKKQRRNVMLLMVRAFCFCPLLSH